MPAPIAAYHGHVYIVPQDVTSGTIEFDGGTAPGEVIHLFGCCSISEPTFDPLHSLNMPTDNKGGTWEQFTTGIGAACIGEAVSESWVNLAPPYGAYDHCTTTLNSNWVRTAGPPLEAGDVINVSWTVTILMPRPGNTTEFYGIAAVIGFENVGGLYIPQRLGSSPTVYSDLYTNSDVFPFPSTPPFENSTTANWEDDLGPEFVPSPVVDAFFVWVTANRVDDTVHAFPCSEETFFTHTGGGWEFTGDVLGLHIFGTLVNADELCEPGGVFVSIDPEYQDGWAGNYMFLSLPDVPPPPAVGFSVSNRFNK